VAGHPKSWGDYLQGPGRYRMFGKEVYLLEDVSDDTCDTDSASSFAIGKDTWGCEPPMSLPSSGLITCILDFCFSGDWSCLEYLYAETTGVGRVTRVGECRHV
jgi:hypothetical protein